MLFHAKATDKHNKTEIEVYATMNDCEISKTHKGVTHTNYKPLVIAEQEFRGAVMSSPTMIITKYINYGIRFYEGN